MTLLVVLSAALGFVIAVVWTSLRNQKLTMKTATIPMISCVGLALVVVALAPARTPTARQESYSAPPVPTPAVSLGALNSKLSTKPMGKKWSHVEFVNVDRDSYRLYLTYGASPTSMAEVKEDTIAVAKLALDALAESGIDPWQGGTFVSVYAQRPEGSAGGKALIRRYGNARFSAITGKFEFEPAN